MSDPFALVPFAAAARGGRVAGFPAGQLVAAGVTLLQRSAPLVRALGGRRSGILLPTGPAYLTALAASDGRGALLLNPLAAPPEIAQQIDEAGVGAVFTVSALASRLPPGLPLVLLDDAPREAQVLAGGTRQAVDLGSHVGLALEGAEDVAGRDEEAVVVYTSGMGGRTMGAVLTHRNLLANARATVSAAHLTADDDVLAPLPFAHLFGLTITGLAVLLAGGAVTPMDRFHPARAIELLERADGPTIVGGVPAVFAAMLALLQRRGTPLVAPRLRLSICGGAVLDPRLQDAWLAATGVELRQGYGLTENAPVALFNHIAQPNRRGSLGVPFPGVEVSIRDPETSAPLPSGTAGEICVRGESVFRGYLVERPGALHVRDGWLHTGDLGVRDEDGSYRFLGLLKDMFTRGGFNIYPREIERVMRDMPGVTEARVVALPDPAREHEIQLEVRGAVDEAAVRAWSEAHLSAYKQPAKVVIT